MEIHVIEEFKNILALYDVKSKSRIKAFGKALKSGLDNIRFIEENVKQKHEESNDGFGGITHEYRLEYHIKFEAY